MTKYLVINDEVAVFYTNEEQPKVIAKWGLGLLERVDSIHEVEGEMEEVSIHMEKVLDQLMEDKYGFFPLDGTTIYPLIYDKCNNDIKGLIDDSFHDEAVKKYYNLNDDEEIYA